MKTSLCNFFQNWLEQNGEKLKLKLTCPFFSVEVLFKNSTNVIKDRRKQTFKIKTLKFTIFLNLLIMFGVFILQYSTTSCRKYLHDCAPNRMRARLRRVRAGRRVTVWYCNMRGWREVLLPSFTLRETGRNYRRNKVKLGTSKTRQNLAKPGKTGRN